jgi:hypothetical protein
MIILCLLCFLLVFYVGVNGIYNHIQVHYVAERQKAAVAAAEKTFFRAMNTE